MAAPSAAGTQAPAQDLGGAREDPSAAAAGAGGQAAGDPASAPEPVGDAGSAGPGASGAAVENADPPPADADAGRACAAPEIAVCNPITNDGCSAELGMQCAVDQFAAGPAGYCVFSAPMDAGACFNSGVTESCPPKTACLAGECRSLCFCDTDCEEERCCVEQIGTTGFKACGDC